VHGSGLLKSGDMVIAWTPKPVRQLAAVRQYVPFNVPLVKRVAAIGGDRVCAVGRTITVNGRRAAVRRTSDSAGRRMPWWSGCRKLGAGEYFLLMDGPDSFDGRYFGLTQRRDVVGRAVLLWAR
jgi:type IV secretory pathway protease TraF